MRQSQPGDHRGFSSQEGDLLHKVHLPTGDHNEEIYKGITGTFFFYTLTALDLPGGFFVLTGFTNDLTEGIVMLPGSQNIFRTVLLCTRVPDRSSGQSLYHFAHGRLHVPRCESHLPEVSRTIFTTSEPTASNITSMFRVYSELWLMIASFTMNAL